MFILRFTRNVVLWGNVIESSNLLTLINDKDDEKKTKTTMATGGKLIRQLLTSFLRLTVFLFLHRALSQKKRY